MINLSEFRWSFIDAQNKANFYNAGKSIISEFRKLQMMEKMENQNDEDIMTVYLQKKRIIFFWRINGTSNVIYLNKETQNWYEEMDIIFLKERLIGERVIQKISIYDNEIIKIVAQRITDIFTGNGWTEMKEIA